MESILKQSFRDWEAILVDDGSTDGCSDICDLYSMKDPRVKVFHKKNEGLPLTREFGVNCAQGSYIMHVDSDDWIEPNMLELLYTNAQINNADIVICDFYMDYEYHSKSCRNHFTDIQDTKQVLRDCINGQVTGYIWNRLIKTECYSDHKVSFPADLGYGEDMIHNVQLISQSVKICYVPEFLYHYVQNSSSMLRKDPRLVMGKLRKKTEWIKNYVGSDFEQEVINLKYREMVLAFRYGLVTKQEFYTIDVPFKTRLYQMKINGPRLNLCLIFLILRMYSIGDYIRKFFFRTSK